MSGLASGDVVRAARAILPELAWLLGDDEAGPFRRSLERLLERAELGEEVADEIEDLLRSRPAARDRLEELLSEGTVQPYQPPREIGRDVSVSPPEPTPAQPRATSVPDEAAPPSVGRSAPARVGTSEPVSYRDGGSGFPLRDWFGRHFGRSRAEPPPPSPEEPREVDVALDDAGVADEDDVAAPAARWILSRVWDLTDPSQPRLMRRAFQADAEHTIEVRVGPVDQGWLGALGGREADSIDARVPTGADQTLAAIFFVPALGLTDRQVLVLPAQGASEILRFSMPPFPAGARVEAWISLIFEGRQVQSARLAGFALADPDAAPDQIRINFQWAALAPGLAEPGVREPFDASLLFDEQGEGIAGLGVPNEDGLVGFDDDDIGGAVNAIRSLLRQVVEAPGLFQDQTSDAYVGLFRALAYQGRVLHEVVGRRLEDVLGGRPLERVQIVQTDRIDYVPLEFVYDLPIPSEDAGLCEVWTDQVRAGSDRCPVSAHPPGGLQGQVTKVCPLGFWALSRVIERQVIRTQGLGPDEFAVRTSPTELLRSLPPLRSALFGFSARVDAQVSGQSDGILATLNAVTQEHTRVVDTWPAWESAIEDRPSLLVLLSHTVQHQSMTALEIGPDPGGSRIKLVELSPTCVRAVPTDTPIVMLLGCDTALEKNEFRSFVGQFLDQGAAIVVGTITPVLGEKVAPVARSLITEIAAALDDATADGNTPEGSSTFGDVMLRLRRELLADGELTALCITSFGDADWRLAASAAGGG